MLEVCQNSTSISWRTRSHFKQKIKLGGTLLLRLSLIIIRDETTGDRKMELIKYEVLDQVDKITNTIEQVWNCPSCSLQ